MQYTNLIFKLIVFVRCSHCGCSPRGNKIPSYNTGHAHLTKSIPIIILFLRAQDACSVHYSASVSFIM